MPPAGNQFESWTGGVDILDSSTSAVTIVTMPDHAVSIGANYKSSIHTLRVSNGSGSGEYSVGATAAITASSISGQIFDQWIGGAGCIESTTSMTTTVTMPDHPTTVTAIYWPLFMSAFEPISGDTTGCRFTWSGAPGRKYRILQSTNISDGDYQCIVSNVNAATIQCEYSITNIAPHQAFYMLQVE